MLASIEQIVWRAALRDASHAPEAQAEQRAAELCLEEGLAEPAQLLFIGTSLRQGFSQAAGNSRATLAARIGLPQTEHPARARSSGEGTVEIAIGELEDFARVASRSIAGSLAAAPASDHASTGGDRALKGPLDLGALFRDLYAYFDETPLAGGAPDGDLLLARLRVAAQQSSAVDYRLFHSAPLTVLATALAMASAREFVLGNHDLLFAPGGSAEVARRAARFDQFALGPYFSNVHRVATGAREIFELAGIAHRAGLEGDADVPSIRWVLLLSQHLTGALRDEVIDELGDLGAMAELTTMFERIVRRRGRIEDIPVTTRLRDAALDNGDYDLAARAQMLVVSLSPRDRLERLILGSIEGTAGRIAAAEQSFLTCLELSPGDREIIKRLEALRNGAFGPYAVRQGFGTPPERLVARLRLRGGRASAKGIAVQHRISVEL